MAEKKHVNFARNYMWISRNHTFLFLWVTLPCCYRIYTSKGPGPTQYFSLWLDYISLNGRAND
jgi:hypothetical protein